MTIYNAQLYIEHCACHKKKELQKPPKYFIESTSESLKNFWNFVRLCESLVENYRILFMQTYIKV